jgi:RimJ/RimL family protein N-acetyltransferase
MSEERPILVSGDRTALVMMQSDDAAVIARWHQNLEFTAMMAAPGEIHTLVMREEAFARGGRPRSDSIEFGVVALESRTLIGFGGLYDIARTGTASIFVGVAPEHWGKGFGSEAVKLICFYGFFYQSLYAIRLQVHAYNKRAIRSYEKCGFKRMGKIRGLWLINGDRHDELLMDLTRDEFSAGDLVPESLGAL